MPKGVYERKCSEKFREANKLRAVGNKNNWKGGILYGGKYIVVYKPHHPMADVKGYVKQHRLVMSKHLGRLLGSQEYVHHIDGDRKNNAIENLQIMTPSEHSSHHNLGKKMSKEACNAISKSSKGESSPFKGIRTSPKTKCLYCGKEFHKNRATHKLCSVLCNNKWRGKIGLNNPHTQRKGGNNGHTIAGRN